MERKIILAIDSVFIVGTLISALFLVGYAKPLVIAPVDNYLSTNRSVLFEVKKADVIFIDDNLEFSSPDRIYLEDNLVINLKPGVYYWKVEGSLPSAIRRFIIQSEIELKLKESDDGESFEIVNAGNTILNVDIYENEKLAGNVVLDVGERGEVKGTKFIGRENE